MTAAAIGASYRHTDQPVRRSSYDVGDPRAQVFRPIGDGTKEGALDFIEDLVATMKAWTDDAKVAGSAHPLTQNAIHLAERVLRRCTDFKTGRCEPSIDHIMAVARFSRATVIKLLAHLRAHGFVDWARRTERTDNRPGDGPAVRQACNAYFFEISRMPKKAQFEMRQRLKKRGRQIFEYPERSGSGPVPTKMQRGVTRLVRALSYAFGKERRGNTIDINARQAEMRLQEAAFDALPRDQRAAFLFPGNKAAQDEFNAEMALLSSRQGASLVSAPESPPKNKLERTETALAVSGVDLFRSRRGKAS